MLFAGSQRQELQPRQRCQATGASSVFVAEPTMLLALPGRRKRPSAEQRWLHRIDLLAGSVGQQIGNQVASTPGGAPA
jgi:hypothetical protein